MDEALAGEIVNYLMRLSDPLNQLTVASSRLPKDDGQQMRRHLAAIMMEIEDLLRPIVRAYPQLDPDRDG